MMDRECMKIRVFFYPTFYPYRQQRKDHEAAMINDDLKQRHIQTWRRAAQAGARCMEMTQEGYEKEDPKYQAARATMLAELATLLELAAQMDKAAGRIETRYYTHGAQSMLKACSVTPQEMEHYQRTPKPPGVTQER